MSQRQSNHRLRNTLTPRGLRAVAATVALAVPPGSPRHALLVWNATASAPVGLYLVLHDRPLSRGDLLLAVPSPPFAEFAARRGYLPRGVPLVKRIAAVAGDTVCATGNAIFIGGRFAASQLAADAQGRSLPAWHGCRTLRSGEVFLLMSKVRASFDGRYFGPTPASEIAGTLEPIWTR